MMEKTGTSAPADHVGTVAQLAFGPHVLCTKQHFFKHSPFVIAAKAAMMASHLSTPSAYLQRTCHCVMTSGLPTLSNWKQRITPTDLPEHFQKRYMLKASCIVFGSSCSFLTSSSLHIILLLAMFGSQLHAAFPHTCLQHYKTALWFFS